MQAFLNISDQIYREQMDAEESSRKAASSHSPKSLRWQCKAGRGALVLLYSYKIEMPMAVRAFPAGPSRSGRGGPLLLGLLAIGSRKAALPSRGVF